ncbi:hypothetical protein Fcan01_18479 [Folsomia candida]|uniref:Uncharacterized protein n=1 Tax=Folsomia candida TaxID=158441 RepID=A0A226DP06_FOLCA|nr:hypothetical protein Fcan01_18479 [Folsomia candida]
MATSKSVLVQLVWTSLICGQVLVSCKPQNSGPSASSSPSKADSADPPSGVSLGKTKGFEVKHGYSFNLANSPDGSPYSSGWAYLGGRAGPGPTYYADDTGYLSNELWSGPAVDIATGSLYTIAAALAFSSLWYTFSPFFSGRASTTPAKKPSASKGSKPSPSKTNTTATEEDSEEKGGQVTPSDKVTTKESVVPGKSSRRRRSLPKSQGAVVAQV